MGSAGFLITYFAAGIFGYVESSFQFYKIFTQFFALGIF